MNPYFIDLGIIHIRWYSILILLAIGLSTWMFYRETKKTKISKVFTENLIFYTLITGILGARLYYVIFNWYYYKHNLLDIVKVWEGGLAIHGGLIAGAIFIYWYTKKHKKPTLKIFDMIVPGLLLGQIIGRFGNFFNSEAYGMITTKAALIKQGIPSFIVKGMHIGGIYYQPTFFYESIWNLTGLIIVIATRFSHKLKIGTLTCFYLAWYGVGRLAIEGLRSDSLLLNGLRVAQLVSILMIIGGIFGYIYLRNQKRPHYHKVSSHDDVEKLDI